MRECPWLTPTGILDFEYSPFTRFYFHLLNVTHTDGQKIHFSVGDFQHPSESQYLIAFLFCFHFKSSFHPLSLSPIHFFHSYLLLSPPILLFKISICRLYLSVFLLYTRAQTQTKASHVGMRVQQIWRWLWDSRDELLEQLHSSLIRWHTDTNQNHNSVLLTADSLLEAKESSGKRPVFCHLR